MDSTKSRYSRNKTEDKQLMVGMVSVTILAAAITICILGSHVI